MRTTVTIDPDTEILLRAEVKRTGRSFKEVLNLSIRRPLLPAAEAATHTTITPLFPAPFPSEFSNTKFNRMADQLDNEATLRELGS